MEETHEHYFSPWADQTSDRCSCGALLISQLEADRRIAEWSNYRELLQTTPAYLDYLEMRAAFKTKDKEKIAKIRKRIEARGHWGKNELGDKVWIVDTTNLVKPSFPNPASWNGYVIRNDSELPPF